MLVWTFADNADTNKRSDAAVYYVSLLNFVSFTNECF